MSVFIVKYENENYNIEILQFFRIFKLVIVKFCILYFRIDFHNKYLQRAISNKKRTPGMLFLFQITPYLQLSISERYKLNLLHKKGKMLKKTKMDFKMRIQCNFRGQKRGRLGLCQEVPLTCQKNKSKKIFTKKQ